MPDLKKPWQFWTVVIVKGVLCTGWGVISILALSNKLGDTFLYRSAFAITAGILSFEKFFEMLGVLVDD